MYQTLKRQINRYPGPPPRGEDTAGATRTTAAPSMPPREFKDRIAELYASELFSRHNPGQYMEVGNRPEEGVVYASVWTEKEDESGRFKRQKEFEWTGRDARIVKIAVLECRPFMRPYHIPDYFFQEMFDAAGVELERAEQHLKVGKPYHVTGGHFEVDD